MTSYESRVIEKYGQYIDVHVQALVRSVLFGSFDYARVASESLAAVLKNMLGALP